MWKCFGCKKMTKRFTPPRRGEKCSTCEAMKQQARRAGPVQECQLPKCHRPRHENSQTCSRAHRDELARRTDQSDSEPDSDPDGEPAAKMHQCVNGCARPSWNGEPGEACTFTCKRHADRAHSQEHNRQRAAEPEADNDLPTDRGIGMSSTAVLNRVNDHLSRQENIWKKAWAQST